MTRGTHSTDARKASDAIWAVADRWRSSSAANVVEFLSPLAGLLVVRWAAFMDAEMEAVSAFDDTPFVPQLPETLRQVSWCDAQGLVARLSTGLLEVGPGHQATIGRYVAAAAPPVLECYTRHREVFAGLVEWVAGLPFDGADGRNIAAAAFDELLEKVMEGQGKFGGEYTTPNSVVSLMVDLVNPKPGDRVYDPCFGVGGLLVEASRRLWKTIATQGLQRWDDVRNNGIFGVEINAAPFVIGLCRMVLAGIDKPGLELGDALERPLPRNRAVEGFDCILAAPPWGGRLLDARSRQYPVPSGGIENLFLQHVMANLRPGGRAVIALPEGTLFRTGPDRLVRKVLLDEYRVDGIIALPEGAFAPCTAVPSSLVVFRREAPRSNVRFVTVPGKAWRVNAGARFGDGDGYVAAGGQSRSGDGIDSSEGQPGSPTLSAPSHSLFRDLPMLIRHERIDSIGLAPGVDAWDVDVSALAARDYELLAKHTGADELRATLERIVATDPSIKVVPLRQVADLALGVTYDKSVTSTNPKEEGTLGLLRVGDFSDFGAKIPGMRLTREGAIRLKEKQLLRAGDVAVTLSGTVGKAAVISDAAGTVGSVPAKSVAVVRCNADVQASFLAALLRSPAYQSWMHGHARGVTIQHLSVRTLGNLPVPVLPIAIQDAVLRTLEPRGDALLLLLRFAAGGTSDPMAAWLERPGVVSLLSDKAQTTDVTHALSGAGHELQELRSLRNRIVHGKEIVLTDAVRHWLIAAAELAPILVGIDTVPEGAPRIAVLELAKSRLEIARRALGFDGDEELITRGSQSGSKHELGSHSRSRLLVIRLRSLMAALEHLLDAATAEMLGPAKLRLKAEPPEVVVGVPTEVRLELENASTFGLRAVRVFTDPDVGTGNASYVAEGSMMRVPLTIHAIDSSRALEIRVRWEAMRLDGMPVRGDETIEILVRSTRQAVLAGDLGPSPYIVGNPIDRDDMFFGRAEVIERIRRQLGSEANANVILLEGNRRTGKTSVLKQLMKKGALPGWIPVYCSFQNTEGDESKAGITTQSVYRLMARMLGWTLSDAGIRTWFPGGPKLEGDRPFKVEFRAALDHAFSGPHPFEIFEEYLSAALEAARPRRVLLMLDEFDKLQEGIDSGVTSPQVPENIRHLLQHHAGLSAVLTGSRRFKRLREEYWSALFGLGYRIGISALPPEDAQRLVIEPVVDRLSYLPAARDLLVDLCARQPFLVQSLCNRVFERAAKTKERIITLAAVNEAAAEMVRDNEHFRTLWGYAQTHRRRLLLVLCDRLADGPDPINLALFSAQLEALGVHVDLDSQIGDDLEYLRELELIEFDKAYRGGTYRIAVPLLGMWIRTSIDFDDAVARAREEAEESRA
ncbi:type I restriction-modification system methyltransferase subunit [Mesoterricola sediminis]|uniref:site-specific DNA-methyltransferase (adenine-specific) n=2 Tax=Mesoterricola sediminis TaxID=2927980 RepID=A0AA48H693_9BACT|nr:type I restriction-modification system methyltransferase subunit [Mesoterricola sediminis]